MDETFSDRFWRRVCEAERVLRYLMVFAFVLLVFLAVSVPFVEAGTGSYYILIIDFLIIGGLLVAATVTLYICKNRTTRSFELDGVSDEERDSE
jgi:prepilin signal peptidase PulO-like enzyme (type II secretory pathway)